MKKLIYILVLSLFIFNCSKSDDDVTFLEKYDGTVWSSFDGYLYLRFVNNLNNPIESIYESNEGCYIYNSDLGSSITITINSNDTFECTIDDDKLTFTVSGNSLKMEMDGDYLLDEPVYLTKSSVDVDSFNRCR
ncbi:hypothetical protein V8G56_02185 [Gaetbulibacter aquiaggeris]|uniref:Lipocalin-like domain-containing protein n=1 Tax=Gaetbulibacter aquiaggeris TaxID=1735373 RepID=A0ABW7ML36_9FLAO